VFGVVAVMDGGGGFIEWPVACVLHRQVDGKVSQIRGGMLNIGFSLSTGVVSCVFKVRSHGRLS
jgi:hypothetical protein